MRSHLRRDNARPSRTEINAAFRAYDLLYAPLTTKENEMAKNLTKETAIATQEPSAVQTAMQTTDGAELSALQAEALERLEQSVAQLRMGFTHVSPTKIKERDEAFYIIDALQTEIPDDNNAGELKTVFVFMLEMQSGDVVTMMQSYNSIRAKWAAPCIEAHIARARGVKTNNPRIGPLKLGTRPAKINDAITFDVQPNFRIQ